LLPDQDKNVVFEASGVSYVDNYFYVIMDSLCLIAKINPAMEGNSPENSMLETDSPCGKDGSDYEGITYDAHGTEYFYVVEEADLNDDAESLGSSTYQPRINKFNATNFEYVSRSWLDFDFKSSMSNNGFEGIAWMYRDDQDCMLGLVESSGQIPVLMHADDLWSPVANMIVPLFFPTTRTLRCTATRLR
jgi:hypothetical protein